MDDLYEHSLSMTSLLDQLSITTDIRIAEGDPSVGPAFYVGPLGGGSTPDLDPYILLSDSKVYGINDNGNVFTYSQSLILAHELGHWQLATHDAQGYTASSSPSDAELNDPAYNYIPSSLQFEQSVASEMGLVQQMRVSYDAAWATSDPRVAGWSEGEGFTDGNQVSVVRSGDQDQADQQNVIDYSAWGEGSNFLIFGFGGNDRITGGLGNDYVYGGAGDDRLVASGGDDSLWGGDRSPTGGPADGIDSIDYSMLVEPITAKLTVTGSASTISVSKGGGGTDTLHSIEVIQGTAGSDTMDVDDAGSTTGPTNYLLVGGGGGDVLIGGSGDDILMPGDGVSTLTGGSGNDWFWLDHGEVKDVPNSIDYTITDGDPGDRVYWNGHALDGGSLYVIDEEDPSGDGVTIGYAGWVDQVGTIYAYYAAFDFMEVILPTNQVIYAPGFQNGDFGWNFRDPPGDFNEIPRSNIANDGVFDDFQNLSGRSTALAGVGSEPVPTMPLPTV